MQDNVLMNKTLEDAVNSNKLESAVFNINKNNLKNKKITNHRNIELVESDNSNNINNNNNNNLNKNQQQQQFKTKKLICEELQIRQQISEIMNRNQNSNANTPSGMAKFGTNNPQTKEESSVAVEEKATPKRVTSRIVFLKVGQIDTRNERYDAEAYLESSWEDDELFKILSDPNMVKNSDNKTNADSFKNSGNTNQNQNQTNLINLKNILNNINYLEYDPNIYWSPQLYCENAIGDLKEEIRHKLEIVEKYNPEPGAITTKIIKTTKNAVNSNNSNANNVSNPNGNLTVKVSEMRKVRGVFYERLELYDFPMDIQEISITITSKRSVDEVQIVENKKDASSINTEDFLDQQEWDLFDFVECANKTIYDPWRKYDRSAFSVKSFISRKPGYYLYNAYMLIFLITVLGFVPFAFEPNGPQFRCQVTGLLLLTSVNFRWIVTQRLPSVPYLTSLDKYAIGSLFYLILFCVWHSIIGSTVISTDLLVKRKVDGIVLYCAAGFYVIYNFGYIMWFFKMARANSNSLIEGREEYKRLLAERAREFEEIEKKKEEAILQQQQPILKNQMPNRTPNIQTRNQQNPNSIGMNNMIKSNQMSLKNKSNMQAQYNQQQQQQQSKSSPANNNEAAFLMA